MLGSATRRKTGWLIKLKRETRYLGALFRCYGADNARFGGKL